MTGIAWRRLAAAGLVLSVCGLTAPALAATVLLVRPSHPNAVTSEALVRIHGELVAAGFEVELATAEADVAVRAAFARGRGGRGPDAVLSILGDDTPTAIEVWVADRVHGRSIVNRTPLKSEGERVAEVLAIRAIELLRSSLLEVAMAKPTLQPPPEIAVPAVVVHAGAAPPVAAEASPWGFEVGAGVSFSTDGVGPAVLPLLRFDRVLVSWCVAQVTVAGLGSRAHVATTAATAELTQQFALVGARFRLRAYHGVRPLASLGAGVLHTGVEGRADWPYYEASGGLWSLLLDAGLGAGVELGHRYALVLTAHAQLAEPYPQISFLGTDVASAGRPTIVLTLALEASL